MLTPLEILSLGTPFEEFSLVTDFTSETLELSISLIYGKMILILMAKYKKL